ncbi:UDP-N-acetylglucosamine diphosphorylase [Papillibacter cinnamivorans]|uniref:Bifunctional UDP-N-acetylglucosamine pyrophosphorylase / Glucosamine-1-phosphate N-acetyltransferase n=1 Tax=Papillibacter cinnamivorans DSM 12816 TaxID=1122930 RepID=A0A1W1ZYU1_9FIRM|nr:UDP-N-acetylglucosamine diphosphorylase [Papillibacter cinnamivorans]SMC53526.1 bifunctional UDP-N-acetylglucosamine pyrophosphorylase / Glucosamine-1-phosphate N-acetyltransferase [Papillibacter cinnamivorans DSM 12816]
MRDVCAIVFFPDDAAREGLEKPLMLQKALFCPVAAWVAQALSAVGVERFFLVCHDKYKEEAVSCFPEGSVVTAGSENPAEQLRAFLSEQETGEVVVVTRPTLILDGGVRIFRDELPQPKKGKPTGLFRLELETMKTALEGGEDFRKLLADKGRELLRTDSENALPPALSVESASDLYQVQQIARYDVIARHVSAGVQFLDANQVYIDPRVRIGKGTFILPGTILRGNTSIGLDCELGPNAMITDCTVGDGTLVNASQLNESVIGSRTKIGPFAYVRPNCVIGDGNKIGDFVEVKNSNLGEGVKISHLTYVGDSDIGSDVNLGCGTVTVNYDGNTKARTVVGEGAFVGCNTNLIAPVVVGEGAYVAAGSTITEDVPPGSLAIARAQQTVKKQWVHKRRK